MLTVLNSDLYNIQIFDSLCTWRSYFIYTEITCIYYSFVIQSYYRYMRVIYPFQPRYSSITTICTIIIVQWIILHGIMLLLPLGSYIEFDVGSQMCSVLLVRYWIIWSMTILIYSPPYNIIAFVYIRLAIFSKKTRMRGTSIIHFLCLLCALFNLCNSCCNQQESLTDLLLSNNHMF
jgi:hypothetical protein